MILIYMCKFCKSMKLHLARGADGLVDGHGEQQQTIPEGISAIT